MEQSEPTNKLITRFFPVIEMALIMLATIGIYLLYMQNTGSTMLIMIALTALVVCYLFKAFVRDQRMGFKPRLIYFSCAIPCISILFALMGWRTYHVLLVGGLAFMALGWGVFLWSNQRQKDHQRRAPQASGYIMFFRLILYTAACLLLLLTEKMG